MVALPCRLVTQKTFIPANNLSSGKDPQSTFFYVVKGEAKVSLEPVGSQLPSAQNNLREEVACLGEVLPSAPYTIVHC